MHYISYIKTLNDFSESAKRTDRGIVDEEPNLEVLVAMSALINYMECLLAGSKINSSLANAWVANYDLRQEMLGNENDDA